MNQEIKEPNKNLSVKEMLQVIQKDIIKLRDSEEHQCPYDEWQKLEEPKPNFEGVCSCEYYDRVLDKITLIKLKLLL